MNPIKLAIIGTGNAARMFHVPKDERCDLFQLIACADAFPESAKTFAEEYSINAYGSIDELLDNDEIEIIVVATKPPTTHHELALKALAKGKHVIVEKPMAETSDECSEMIAAAETAGKVLTIHHNRRWDVDFLNARDALAQNLLGELRLLRNEYAGGYKGSVYDWGIHVIDQTMCLSSDQNFIEISAAAAHPNAEDPTECEGFFTATLIREDGVIYQMSMLPVIQGNALRPGRMLPRFVLIGTNGTMMQDWCQTPMDGYGSSIRFESAEKGMPQFGYPPSFQAKLAIPDFYESLYAAIRDNKELPVSAESGRRAVLAWELVCKAAVEGRSLPINL